MADLRLGRGLIDLIEERTLWEMLSRIVWPNGPVCPHCGEKELGYLKEINPDYRRGLGRWQCRVCAEAGDPGQGGTFTPLTGTILAGMRLDVRTLWLIAASFAQGQASVETAKEAQVNRHTTDRLFRLCRAALYQGRSAEPLTLTVQDIVEMDEVYITAGLKGHAGGLELELKAACLVLQNYLEHPFSTRIERLFPSGNNLPFDQNGNARHGLC